jgi:hypothetical protein
MTRSIIRLAVCIASLGNDVAELVDVAEHLIVVRSCALKRGAMGLPLEDLQQLLYGVCLLE